MDKKTNEIIKLLQEISQAKADADEQSKLIQQFQEQFPEQTDWLEMLKQDNTADSLPQLPRISSFTLLKSIGTGANGQVFLAIDKTSKQQVAIKVPHSFLNPEQKQRFLHESQLLSRLSHSNIAKILQTGLLQDQDLPYIAMEFVEGKNIHQYCRDKDLNFRQIIELFKQVLEAVQYAHQRGIIHRDIKPDNILVNQKGQVKLVDFGIAMLSDNSTQHLTQLTRTGEIVGTLSYMSPEQVSGSEAIDTRTDIYSLGVVLYQLLAKKLPFSLNANQLFSAISQIIEDLPKKLNKQNSAIDTDLTTIVHHAMEKNPEQRYQSASEFKKDLENWLAGNSINVQHNTLWHSLKHMGQKHKALVSGALLAIVGLITGLVFAVSFALKEQKARELAETNAKTSEKTVAFISEIFSKANPERIYGDKLTLLQVIDNTNVSLLQNLKDEEQVQANIRLVLADVYVSLGKEEQATKQLNEIDVLLSTLANSPHKTDLLFKKTLIEVDVNIYQGNFDENIKIIMQVLNKEKLSLKQIIRLKNKLAFSYSKLGKYQQAQALLDELKKTFKSQQFPDDDNFVLDIQTFSQITLGDMLNSQGKHQQAKDLYQNLADTLSDKLGRNNPQTLSALNNLALALANLDQAQESLKLLNEIVDSYKETIGEQHLSTLIAQSNVLYAMVKQGQLEEADDYSAQLIQKMTQAIGATHNNTLIVKNIRAYLLEDLGHLQQAEDIYLKLMDDYKQLNNNDNPEFMNIQNNLAMLYIKQEKLEQAQLIFENLINKLESSGGTESFYYALFTGNYGELLLKLKQKKKAKKYLQISYTQLSKNLGENHQRTLKAKKSLQKLANYE